MSKIGTHNGTFHCDEVLACFLLKQLPKYKDSEIIRTRNPSILSKCDIVVDVGGVFDPEKNKYDHHQKTFNETFKTLKPEKPWDIKLSSAGLIYLYFGKEVLTEICKQYETNIDLNILYDKMYEHFVMEIDAIDNGIPVCDGEPRYPISSSLSGRVKHINPWWNQKSDEDALFRKAMELVGSEFMDKVNFYVNCWWSGRDTVQKAIDGRYTVHESGLILKFEQGLPWKSHFFDLEKNIKESSRDNQSNGDGEISPYQIRFALFNGGDSWRVQCIPISEKQEFANRLDLLEEWKGIRDEELCLKSGIPGSIFVHANGFIGGNKTYDGALKMAVKTLQHAKLIK